MNKATALARKILDIIFAENDSLGKRQTVSMTNIALHICCVHNFFANELLDLVKISVSLQECLATWTSEVLQSFDPSILL